MINLKCKRSAIVATPLLYVVIQMGRSTSNADRVEDAIEQQKPGVPITNIRREHIQLLGNGRYLKNSSSESGKCPPAQPSLLSDEDIKDFGVILIPEPHCPRMEEKEVMSPIHPRF